MLAGIQTVDSSDYSNIQTIFIKKKRELMLSPIMHKMETLTKCRNYGDDTMMW